MMRTLSARVPRDADLPERAWRHDVLTRFLDDTIYDLLAYEFHEERSGNGDYIPIAERAPSVRCGLLGTVVAESVSFLFGEGRFPLISAGSDTVAAAALAAIIDDCDLNQTMIEASSAGSVGSVVLWLRVLDKKIYVAVLSTRFLTPEWLAATPDTLARVTEQYKVKGSALRAEGYDIDDDDLGRDFWFRRAWDERREIWYRPWRVGEAPAGEDEARSVEHGLGFVPMVWVRNLPGGDAIDGACTFRAAIEDSIEINYQMSQAGRGLKYSSSPMLVLKDPSPLPLNRQHIVGDALVLPPEGDARMLEISGEASEAVVAYVREVRKMALEASGGSRADSDKLGTAQSGRAMELMNQPLINLADKLRASYGKGGLLKLLKMIAAASRLCPLETRDGVAIPAIAAGTRLTLNWPRWYAPTAEDRQADATALSTLTAGQLLSRQTAVAALASVYDFSSVEDELDRIG